MGAGAPTPPDQRSLADLALAQTANLRALLARLDEGIQAYVGGDALRGLGLLLALRVGRLF
jgi:hypothetical protein